jgi:hypothetical protein
MTEEFEEGCGKEKRLFLFFFDFKKRKSERGE